MSSTITPFAIPSVLEELNALSIDGFEIRALNPDSLNPENINEIGMYVRRDRVARFLAVVSHSSNAVLAMDVINNLREARDSGVNSQDNFVDLAPEFVALTQSLRLKIRQLNGTLIESVQENMKSNAVMTVATPISLDTATADASTEVAVAAANFFNEPTLTEAVNSRVTQDSMTDIDPHLIVSTTDEGDINTDHSRAVPFPPSYEEALKGIEALADYGAVPLPTAAAAVEVMCQVGTSVADVTQEMLDGAKAVSSSIPLIEGGAVTLLVALNQNVRSRTVTRVIPMFFSPEAAQEYLTTGALTMYNAEAYNNSVVPTGRNKVISDVIEFASVDSLYAFVDAFNHQQSISRVPKPPLSFTFHALGRQYTDVNEYEMRLVASTAKNIWTALRKVCLNKDVQAAAITVGKGLLGNLFAKFNASKTTTPDKCPINSFIEKGPDYVPTAPGVTINTQRPYHLTSLSYIKQACEEARNLLTSTTPNRQATGVIAGKANTNYRQILGLPITSIRSEVPTRFRASRMV